MKVALVLRLESGIQIKEMERLDHADMFVQKRVIEEKTKEII
jgi:hypothetical protein